MKFLCLLALLASACLSTSATAELRVRDETGQEIRLPGPARRIVALAPHLAETLYAAGAGERLIGTVDYSDFPAEARKLPRVGGYSRLDLEAIAALKPDLVMAWQSGNHQPQLDKLRALGLTIYISQPNRLEDIPAQLERFGELAGSEAAARKASQDFRQRLEKLRQTHAGKSSVRVFYQVWKSPLMTVGGSQIISDVIRLCGGENVFGQLKPMAPAVSVEAVLSTEPEAIIASGMGDARPEWLDDWKRWPQLTAVKRGNLFHISPDIVQRHTPRILLGAEKLCAHLDVARSHRPTP